MKSSFKKGQRKNRTGLLFLFSLLCALVSSSALSRAANPAVSNAQPVTGISVTNNSTREIRHLYLSPVDRNNWGPDLLDGTIVRNGESFTISDAACTGNEIKVIAEDQQGCFLYGVVSCAQATTSWTITNDTPADCG
jgi:hypothetical protein